MMRDRLMVGAAFFLVASCTSKASSLDGQPTTPVPKAESVPPAAPASEPPTELEALIAKCKAGDALSCYDGAQIVSKPGASESDNRVRADLEFRGCELGHGASCNDYGAALANGLGVARDNKAAVTYFRKACENGSMFGCVQFGARLEDGRGIEKDVARARTLYEKACDGNERRGCQKLAGFLFYSGGTEDRSRAIEKYEQACKLGSAFSCFRASKLGSQIVVPPGLAERKLFSEKESCAKGYGVGCYSVGQFYSLGFGAPRDLAKAMAFYKRGCDLQFTASCEVVANLKEAAMRRAAIDAATKRCDRKRVDAKACYKSGVAYLHGRDVDADPITASRRLRQACGAKHAASCHELGYAAFHGLAGKPNRKRSMALIAKACRLGRAASCIESGMFLVGDNEKPTVKNLKKARRYFERGCKLGNAPSCDNAITAELRLKGEKADRARVRKLAARGCELGSAGSCRVKQQIDQQNTQRKKLRNIAKPSD